MQHKVNTARFWVYWNQDWVKLSVKRGQSIELNAASLTDEGSSYVHERYEFPADEDVVRSEVVSGGCDCDGPISHFGSYECPLAGLFAYPEESDEYGDRPERPDWQRVSAAQRDYYAEAAGY